MTVPRRMLMIGYNTVAEAAAKGILRRDDPGSMELHYNYGAMFDDVLYVVPFGRENNHERLTDTIQYRECAFERGGSGARLAIAGFGHVGTAKRFIDTAVRDFRPDVVQICGPHIPAVLALLSKEVRQLPSVCFIEAFWETILPQQLNLPRPLRAVLPMWYRWLYRRFDRYTGAPSVAPEYYVARGMDRARISGWIQPIDLRQLERANPADAPASVLAAPRPRIVVMGRLHPEKLAQDALEIFARALSPGVPGTLVFVGDGSERAAIEARSRELGVADRTIITGLLPHAQALATLKACDYSIAPMQGSALLESMAAGLTIVAYDHETHRALITDGVTGILVPHRDIAAASAVLSGWLADERPAKVLASAAREQVAERYGVANVRTLLFSAFVDAATARTAATTTPSNKPHQQSDRGA